VISGFSVESHPWGIESHAMDHLLDKFNPG